MIVTQSLVNEIFRAFHMQRWNDRLRPVELIEMDKHAHKMITAYCLAKYEEADGKEIEWHELIKGGIYELLRRIIISDIKSPIYAEIKKDKTVFAKLNEFVFRELDSKIESEEIMSEIHDFLFDENWGDKLYQRILEASHIYATYWEFQIIKQSNPFAYQRSILETDLSNRVDTYRDLIGIKKARNREPIDSFLDMTGQMRFQYRWAQIPRTPTTAVLGHSLLVASIAYFFARENDACERRLYNDFFGGLFHDLPEAVTRDIISPVKRSSTELDELISKLEKELAEKEIYPLIEPDWIKEIEYFTHDEFSNKVIIEGEIKTGLKVQEINDNYNTNDFNPIDGKLIRAADHLAAFLEAYNSIKAGISTEELISACVKLKEQYKDRKFGKTSVKQIYSSFVL